MTQAIDVKPLVIPDRDSLIENGVVGDALLHLLDDIKNRFKTIAAYQEPVIPDPPDTTGRLIAGTPLVLNPVALSTITTQAHGLGVKPDFIKYAAECLIAELGYSVGDVVHQSTSNLNLSSDATSIFLAISPAMTLTRKDTGAVANVTVANWKITLTPYKLST